MILFCQFSFREALQIITYEIKTLGLNLLNTYIIKNLLYVERVEKAVSGPNFQNIWKQLIGPAPFGPPCLLFSQLTNCFVKIVVTQSDRTVILFYITCQFIRYYKH